jgi:hypothetical protein
MDIVKEKDMNVRDSMMFKRVMWFKFFMVIFVWGLIPLLIPENLLPFFGLHFNQMQIILLRIWGAIVLLDTFIYIYIYNHPHTKVTKWLLLFSVADNGGIGTLLLILTFIYHFPWGIWVHVPFQLFFGYWFWKFYKAGKFTKLKAEG